MYLVPMNNEGECLGIEKKLLYLCNLSHSHSIFFLKNMWDKLWILCVMFEIMSFCSLKDVCGNFVIDI